MNRAVIYDSVDPRFILPPTDSLAIKEFLIRKWDSGSADYHWPWKPENTINHLWPLEENLAYTNDTLKTGGMGDFPLGDLYRWWPEEYAEWKLQEENENARISYWLEAGKDTAITDVTEKTNRIKGFELLQNYPNPFNPTTVISYKLKVRSKVGLKIYDILGREIATLVNEEKPAGIYRINFYAEDIPSGVYFYQLKVKNSTETKKLILIR
ncbi:MAG: T9SS type A sorting domain-containing protein [Bacteroidetes bacterium]|nr:T9SS type A sorting domain-containing protein [Bacteroidota bacterium]